MNRTKFAITALMAWGTPVPDGPPWFIAIVAVMRMSAGAYLLWYFFSDTEPRETYAIRPKGWRVER